MEILTRNDGYDEWRYRELEELSRSVEERFQLLQDPDDCEDRKYLTCYSDNSNCGWGCFYKLTNKQDFIKFLP
jgi:hypothetical protein